MIAEVAGCHDSCLKINSLNRATKAPAAAVRKHGYIYVGTINHDGVRVPLRISVYWNCVHSWAVYRDIFRNKKCMRGDR